MDTLQQKIPALVTLTTWATLWAGSLTYGIVLWDAPFSWLEKGYYLLAVFYSIFCAVSIQKSIRDRREGLPVSVIYSLFCWFSLVLAFTFFAIGLSSAPWSSGAKSMMVLAFALILLGVITVQKNIRDAADSLGILFSHAPAGF